MELPSEKSPSFHPRPGLASLQHVHMLGCRAAGVTWGHGVLQPLAIRQSSTCDNVVIQEAVAFTTVKTVSRVFDVRIREPTNRSSSDTSEVQLNAA